MIKSVSILQKMFKYLLVIAVLITTLNGISFKLESQQQFCLKMSGTGTYSFMYIVSGVNQNMVTLIILKDDTQIKRIENQIQSEFNLQMGGDLRVCFSTDDSSPKEISFDFYKKADPLRQVIDKKDIQLVEQALQLAGSEIERISENQLFHIERDEIHKKVLEESETKIKWAGIIKIIFLLSSALIQLWIMKSFFKQSQSYQPVSDM